MIKIFRGGRGGDTFKPRSPPTNNFCLYPPPILRCFWKDPLMTPTTPLQVSFTATPLPIHHPFPPPLKILIVHLLPDLPVIICIKQTDVCSIDAINLGVSESNVKQKLVTRWYGITLMCQIQKYL